MLGEEAVARINSLVRLQNAEELRGAGNLDGVNAGGLSTSSLANCGGSDACQSMGGFTTTFYSP